MLKERTVCWFECDKCSYESPDFDSEAEAADWASRNGWRISDDRVLCDECEPSPVCDQCGRGQDDYPSSPIGYVRRVDGRPFDDWRDRWLMRGDKAWCPDHWHVECDECHTHESGHADALEYHGWRVGERTLCPECAANQRKD